MAAAALALTACGGGDDGEGEGGGSEGKKSYTIGYMGPISGDNAAIGENESNGSELAVKLANEKGDLPFTLKYVESDDVGTSDQGPVAAQKLIDDESVVAVVGPAFSGPTKSSGQLFTEASLVTVSPSATNPDLTKSGFTSFVRIVPPDDAQGVESARYMAKALKAKKVYSLNDKTEYGVGLAGVIEKTLAEEKVETVKEGIPVTKDYSTVAQKIKNSGADAMYYSGYFPEFALLTKALKQVGYTGALLSGDGSNDDEYIKQATPAIAEGVYLTCPCGDANVDPNAKAFLDAYKAEFGKVPGTYSPESYDAANVIIEAMRSIGDGEVTRESVLEAVKKLDFKGITKQINFTDAGEVEGNTIFMYQVKDGKRVVLGTTEELAK